MLLAVVRSKLVAGHVVAGSETASTALARVGKVAPERLHQRLTIALSLASSTRGLLLFSRDLAFLRLEAFRKNSILRLPHSTRNSLLRLRKDAVFDGPVLCRAVRLKYCRREAPCKRPVGIVRAAATRSTVTCTPNAPAALAMGGECLERRDGVDDGASFLATVGAMRVMGFARAERRALFGAVF